MAAEQRILKQDGYLDVGCISRSAVSMDSGSVEQFPTSSPSSRIDGQNVQTTSIVYHPNLNVILVFDSINQIKVLDVHSGVILQTYQLGNGKLHCNKPKKKLKKDVKKHIDCQKNTGQQ